MNSEPETFEGSPSESRQGPFSGPSPKLDRLIDGVRSLEQWYAVDFERRVAGLTEMLKTQITQELRAQFTVQLNAQVEQTRQDYEERLAAHTREWDLQRDFLEKEIAELRRRVPSNDVKSEIAATEVLINASSSGEMERLIPNSASLARLLQSRVEDLEAQAYLRGLKFALPDNKIDS